MCVLCVLCIGHCPALSRAISRDPPFLRSHAGLDAANIASLLLGLARDTATRFSNIGVVSHCVHAEIAQHLAVPVEGSGCPLVNDFTARIDACPIDGQVVDGSEF